VRQSVEHLLGVGFQGKPNTSFGEESYQECTKKRVLRLTKEEDGEMKLEHGQICSYGHGGVAAFVGGEKGELEHFLEE
jgi:hypothetical protein